MCVVLWLLVVVIQGQPHAWNDDIFLDLLRLCASNDTTLFTRVPRSRKGISRAGRVGRVRRRERVRVRVESVGVGRW